MEQPYYVGGFSKSTLKRGEGVGSAPLQFQIFAGVRSYVSIFCGFDENF